MTEASEFWALVSTGPGCWQWLGAVDRDGYGQVWWYGRSSKAHRIAYQLVHGPIPDGLLVCHHCDVPGCINPAHLWLGEPRDNSADMVGKGRAAAGDKNSSAKYPELRRGERNGRAKLNAKQVEMIRLLWAAGATTKTMARDYGIDRRYIYRIVSGERWRQ